MDLFRKATLKNITDSVKKNLLDDVKFIVGTDGNVRVFFMNSAVLAAQSRPLSNLVFGQFAGAKTILLDGTNCSQGTKDRPRKRTTKYSVVFIMILATVYAIR